MDHFDLTIESSGEGWMGTFGVVLATLAEDILSDGAPFSARITWEHHYASDPITHDVWVVAVDRALNVLTVRATDELGGQADIEFDAIRKLEV